MFLSDLYFIFCKQVDFREWGTGQDTVLGRRKNLLTDGCLLFKSLPLPSPWKRLSACVVSPKKESESGDGETLVLPATFIHPNKKRYDSPLPSPLPRTARSCVPHTQSMCRWSDWKESGRWCCWRGGVSARPSSGALGSRGRSGNLLQLPVRHC